MKRILKKILLRMRGEVATETLIARGMKVGSNFYRMHGVLIDAGHCWLISIGDNVRLGPRVHILAHDGSLQYAIGATKIGLVTIGNNVFIGADTVVLPGVNIGDNVIIGVNSVISRDIPSNLVVAGNPALPIMSYDEYINRHKDKSTELVSFDKSYTFHEITEKKKAEMIEVLKSNRIGYLK